MDNIKTNSSLLGGFSLALLGTTCCALPIFLVTFGLGSAVASMISVMPWLVPLSEYKALTFSVTAIILAYCFFRLRRITYCELSDKRLFMWQRALLWTSTVILIISIFAAYLLLPLTIWWEAAYG